jgi:hypothetical protein
MVLSEKQFIFSLNKKQMKRFCIQKQSLFYCNKCNHLHSVNGVFRGHVHEKTCYPCSMEMLRLLKKDRSHHHDELNAYAIIFHQISN